MDNRAISYGSDSGLKVVRGFTAIPRICYFGDKNTLWVSFTVMSSYFSEQMASFNRRDIKMLVIACNTTAAR